jgi:NitT/TauT family transport system substrate-binding protein
MKRLEGWARRAFLLATLALAQMILFQTGASALENITVSLDFRPFGRHAGWFVALDKGYYKAAGLNVTIIPSTGTAQAIQSVESGVAQFAFTDVAAVVAARANSGSNSKIIAMIYQKAPYALFSRKSGANLTEPKQLVGAEIGEGAGSFTSKVIDAFMLQHKLDPTTVKYTQIDPAVRVSMLVAKKIPIIVNYVLQQPGIEKALGDDSVTFLMADHGLNLYSNGIVAREDFLKAHPDWAKAFVEATLKGYADTFRDPQFAVDTVMKYQKALSRDISLQEIAIVKTLVVNSDTAKHGLGTMNMTQMQSSVDFILATISKKGVVIPAADIADPNFLPTTPIMP